MEIKKKIKLMYTAERKAGKIFYEEKTHKNITKVCKNNTTKENKNLEMIYWIFIYI